jgi:hypothetical protein
MRAGRLSLLALSGKDGHQSITNLGKNAVSQNWAMAWDACHFGRWVCFVTFFAIGMVRARVAFDLFACVMI